MQDLAVMTVFEGEANLSEPIEDLVLRQVVLGHLWLPLVARLIVLNLQGHVTA